jgi:hypothetical protein
MKKEREQQVLVRIQNNSDNNINHSYYIAQPTRNILVFILFRSRIENALKSIFI